MIFAKENKRIRIKEKRKEKKINKRKEKDKEKRKKKRSQFTKYVLFRSFLILQAFNISHSADYSLKYQKHYMQCGLDRHDLNCKYLQIVISCLVAAI